MFNNESKLVATGARVDNELCLFGPRAMNNTRRRGELSTKEFLVILIY
jgi:hypothetical protein